jgi:hypothetical protein
MSKEETKEQIYCIDYTDPDGLWSEHHTEYMHFKTKAEAIEFCLIHDIDQKEIRIL